MNPTTSLFVKLAIFIGFSLQVCAFESFSNSQALSNVQDELQALHLARRQLDRQQAGEAAAAGPKEANGKETVSKGEELAGKLFDTIAQMGSGLETVTSLGSNSNEILEHSKKVQGLAPQINSLAKNLIATAPEKADELKKSLKASGEAADSLTKSLKAIDEKPDDVNLIKEKFKSLEKSFQTMLAASDNVVISTVPKIAELVKNEQQKEAAQAGQTAA